MRWAGDVKNRLRRVTLPLAAAILGMFWLVVPAQVGAVNSEIGAIVCGTTPPAASITITEPNNDSVVNQSNVTVRGTVSNASQIDVRVDGQYSNTLAVGPTQTSFETQVGLSAGTHTISVIANAICEGEDGSDSIVVTYETQTDPSDGGSTPTDVGDGVVVGGEVSGNEEVKTTAFQQLPVIGAAVAVISDFAAFTGLDATIPSSNTFLGVSRIGLTTAALALVVAAGSVAPIVLQAAPGLTKLFNTTSIRSRMYVGWLLRVGGLLLMGLVYFL